ncbi:probable E3 ubiquitin-protein ligase WAVH2 isoform X2 [Cannabis sativa]|uniref:probable E3 ubiquitin-protein ligase WAVH2 isoform X2 n=1 Tax=Cannabis sativa TaxID=3483 RepID=UPI0029CA481C|nr:probable E3 ubiquitin-protein ligase WAVH2 isoform X2 [Cannabis sativa]
MGGGRGASSRLRKAARNIAVAAASACGSFSRRKALVDPIAFDNTNSESNLCAICLDPLNYNSKGSNSPSQAIFTAQCSHAFHFACISSNVRHGSVTCPICRAHWTQLPRNLNAPCASINHTDPILRILDDSIATFRIHRRSFIRSARYDDDDPIEPEEMSNCPRLQLSLVPIPTTSPTNYQPPLAMPLSRHLQSSTCSSSSSFLQTNRAYLSVKLANQRATDLVLVASPNGPHLRLLKQCMALLVFSLRPTDRLAIVTYSSAAARVFPLRRMTSCGRRAALQVIDRLFYMGQADPVEGLKKGIKILQDRAHKNPESGILHLSDSPTQSYHASMMNMEVPIPVHRFHVGFGYGTSSGYIMHGFEEFLAGLLGGVIREIQLRVRTGNESANGMVVRIGELRGDEERRVLLDLGESGHACVEYSYSEDVGEVDERFITGETLVSVGDSKSDAEESGLAEEAEEVAGGGSGGGGRKDAIGGGRPSSVESWDYHDPYMARRWAKHLHGGYRF